MNNQADLEMLKAVESICERLTERSASLFLGAGVNYGIKNANGTNFPLGGDLAKLISHEILGIEDSKLALLEAAEMARHRMGDLEFNKYIHSIFESFGPSPAHLSLLTLPWDCVFTTNYDTLLEQAHGVSRTKYHQIIQPIFSNLTNVETLGETTLPYYKLHGCIDYANTPEGRLIITQSDYRFYETHRRHLFNRLERDLSSRCFVFIGYSLQDPNFTAIITDACAALDVASLPRSYAIRKDFTEAERGYWLDKYNIQLINSTAELFVGALQSTWESLERVVLTPRQRYEKQLQIVDSCTSLPIIGDAFYRLDLGQITGQSDPARFFCGGEPTWPDIRDDVAPNRSAYWPILEAIIPEISDPGLPSSVYLITGSAGTGKTTLAKSICYDLLKDFDETIPVLLHIPGTPTAVNELATLSSRNDQRRIIIYFSHAASDIEIIENLFSECKRLKIPVTFLLEERKNQWLSQRHFKSSINPPEFEIAALNSEEIEDILDSLEKSNCLGALTGKSREIQTSHFQRLAHQDLLVALRELTCESSFDKIIEDEYNRIPTTSGRSAYLYASAFGQLDLALRYETLQHLLDIKFSEFGPSVFTPTEGILMTVEPHGNSRHNFGFRVCVRHPIIASIIFALGAPSDEAKFDVVNQIISRLDPGYCEDRKILHSVVRRKELANTFSDPEMRRDLYKRLESILPDDPHVLQHRAILEKDLRNGDAAVKFARKALRVQPNNAAFKNTLGLALEYSARGLKNQSLKDSLIREAQGLFEDGVRRNKSDPYSYLGIAFLMKQRIHDELATERRTLLKAELLSYLEEAYEATNESNQIATELASVRASIGSIDDAIEAIKRGLEVNPADTRLRDIWIEIERERGNWGLARNIAVDGIHNDPTSWRLHRSLARINRRLEEPLTVVSANYEGAIRHHKGDASLLVEYGSYLFMSGKYELAPKWFQDANRVVVDGSRKGVLTENWRDKNGHERRFEGKVHSITGARASVFAIPENFEAFFWRTREDTAQFQIGAKVQFTVSFNTYGPFAHIIRRIK